MSSQFLALPDRDVVFVTLDSCRYDVALAATVPVLSGLSRLMKAETPGTYTLPAHIAYFNGFLPFPVQKGIAIGSETVDVIWRSDAARSSSLNVLIPFAGRTLMEHYHKRG